MVWQHILMLVSAIRPVHPEILERFAAWECRRSEETIRYRVFLPDICTRPIPLMVWMHGRGEMGENNRDQLAWLELLFDAQSEDQSPAFGILAYQCPEDGNGWFARCADRRAPLDQLELAIQDVCERAPIAPRRIYLVGISQGAAAAVELANRIPSRYAAMLLMGPSGLPDTVSPRAAGIPVWVFQSRGDGPTALERTIRYVSDVRRLGGSAQLTVVDSIDHDCWTDAFHRYQAQAWLLKQRNGVDEIRAALWGAFVMGVGLACVVRIWWRRSTRLRKGRPTSEGRCLSDSSWGPRLRPFRDAGANGRPADDETDSRVQPPHANDTSEK